MRTVFKQPAGRQGLGLRFIMISLLKPCAGDGVDRRGGGVNSDRELGGRVKG